MKRNSNAVSFQARIEQFEEMEKAIDGLPRVTEAPLGTRTVRFTKSTDVAFTQDGTPVANLGTTCEYSEVTSPSPRVQRSIMAVAFDNIQAAATIGQIDGSTAASAPAPARAPALSTTSASRGPWVLAAAKAPVETPIPPQLVVDRNVDPKFLLASENTDKHLASRRKKLEGKGVPQIKWNIPTNILAPEGFFPKDPAWKDAWNNYLIRVAYGGGVFKFLDVDCDKFLEGLDRKGKMEIPDDFLPREDYLPKDKKWTKRVVAFIADQKEKKVVRYCYPDDKSNQWLADLKANFTDAQKAKPGDWYIRENKFHCRAGFRPADPDWEPAVEAYLLERDGRAGVLLSDLVAKAEEDKAKVEAAAVRLSTGAGPAPRTRAEQKRQAKAYKDKAASAPPSAGAGPAAPRTEKEIAQIKADAKYASLLHEAQGKQPLDRDWSLDRPSDELPVPPSGDAAARAHV